MADDARAADTEELLGREVGVVHEPARIDHHHGLRQRIEDRRRELLAECMRSLEGMERHARRPAVRAPAGRTTPAGRGPYSGRSRDSPRPGTRPRPAGPWNTSPNACGP